MADHQLQSTVRPKMLHLVIHSWRNKWRKKVKLPNEYFLFTLLTTLSKINNQYSNYYSWMPNSRRQVWDCKLITYSSKLRRICTLLLSRNWTAAAWLDPETYAVFYKYSNSYNINVHKSHKSHNHRIIEPWVEDFNSLYCDCSWARNLTTVLTLKRKHSLDDPRSLLFQLQEVLCNTTFKRWHFPFTLYLDFYAPSCRQQATRIQRSRIEFWSQSIIK